MDDRRPVPPDRWPAVRAPGKVMLAGEFGVLVGASALVMAVDRHLIVGSEELGRPLADPGDSLVRALLEEASIHSPVPGSPPSFDDRSFLTADGRKLGLGSSAAKAAGLMASAFLLAGEDIRSQTTRARILDAALRAHRRVGGGSGADVAASVLGGAIRYRILVDDENQSLLSPSSSFPPYEAIRVSVPEDRLPLVVHGGAPLSTRGALQKLKLALAKERSTSALLRDAADAGEALVQAIIGSSLTARELVAAVDDARRALHELSVVLGLQCKEGSEALERACSVARHFGGAAKPSGAGAGDLVLIFLPSASTADRDLAASRLDRAGLHVLNLVHDDCGVRSEGGRPMIPT